MRLRNIPGSRDRIAVNAYVIPESAMGETWPIRGKWADEFGNTNPVRIEIGMGKGAFIMEQARLNPDINYVGIEKFSSVLIRALEKQDTENLPNLRFLRMEAEYITDVFAPGEVDRIYLNFSDPWPKEKHAKRRLTSHQFLSRYDRILKEDGVVEFKTDNPDLFSYSLKEAAVAGWMILDATCDLHNSYLSEGNIMTEYEEKFSSLGQKINKYIIRRNLE